MISAKDLEGRWHQRNRDVSYAILEETLRLCNNMLVNAQGAHTERARLEPAQRESLRQAVGAVHESMQILRDGNGW